MKLPDRIGGARIEKQLLPVTFLGATVVAIGTAERLSPDAVVCLGQAAGRDALTPERIAVNLLDAKIPDNDGFQPRGVPIVRDGPAAYFSTLPIREMTAAMLSESVPARVSDDAGTFVCNSLFYSLRRWSSEHRPDLPCGLIHIPYLTGQDHPPGMPAVPGMTVLHGVTAALEVVAKFT